jgi:hypothetical protein
MSAQIIDKVAKLHAHMVSAKELGNDAEALAFSEMMQRLLAQHNLDMSDVEFAQMKREEPVQGELVDLHKHGLKVKRSRVLWQENLASIVAGAHMCRILIHPGSNYFTLVGRKHDREVAEYMIVTLIRNLERIADKEYTRYFYKCRDEGNVTKARGYHAAFLQGFTIRLAQRYQEAKRALEAEPMALVRFSMRDVDDLIAKLKTGTATALAQPKFHRDGYNDGKDAANKINLGPNAVKAGTNKGQLT